MSDRFQNKYRIESARLKQWDYGWNASYFVTICTQGRICFFGDVVNNEMVLNDIGSIAQDCWMQIPKHFPFVKLGHHVVMPNHVHGIVVIDKPDDIQNGERDGIDAINRDGIDAINRVCRDAINRVSTNDIIDPINAFIPSQTKQNGGITGNNNPMLHDNLSKIIRWYKGRTTFESRKIINDFAWQSRFHDHIIRNDESFQRVSEYIVNNPANWKNDEFF